MQSQGPSSERFIIPERGRRSLSRVSDAEDDPVARYVRMRLRQLLTKQPQIELAQRIGVSPSGLSQVKDGKEGVGSRSIGRYARALGFKSPEALRQAAWAWVMTEAKLGASLALEPAVADAIRTVCALRPEVSETTVRTILHAFGHDRFRGRSVDYWVRTLLDELQFESQ